jgi:hypothetical protein
MAESAHVRRIAALVASPAAKRVVVDPSGGVFRRSLRLGLSA